MKAALFRLFHFTVAVYGVFLLWVPFASLAQIRPLPSTVQQYQILDLDRRIATLEGLGIDRRLGVIEAKISWGDGAVGLLVLKAAHDAHRARKQKGAA